MPEREEMASSNSIELQPHTVSSQRQEDQQEKEYHSFEEIFFEVFHFPNTKSSDSLIISRCLRKYGTITFKVSSKFWELSGPTYLKNLIISVKNLNSHQPANRTNFSMPLDKNSSNSSPNTAIIIAQEIQKFQHRFEQKRRDTDKSKVFNVIMSQNREKQSGVDEVFAGLLRDLLNSYHKEHSKPDKQYAFAVVVLKDCRLRGFSAAYPENRKKNECTPKKHSEEFLIEEIDTYFHEWGQNVEIVYIYTYYSPCLNGTDSCMFKLLRKSYEWLSEYGFPTTVIFSEFYGFSGSNYFQNAAISDILDEYSNKCKNGSFVLNCKDFNKLKPGGIRTVSDIERKHREQQLKIVKSALEKIKSETKDLCLTKQEYLNHGKKIIQDNMHNQPEKTINTLIGEWNKMVRKSFKEYQRKKITSDFNAAVVHVFEKELKSSFGSNSPLQLYHLVSRSENILN